MKKFLVVLLIASLAANAAFVVLRVSKTSSAGSDTPTTRDAAAKKTADAAATTGPDSEVSQIARAWKQMQDGDIRTLADRLRAAGFSPSMVKAIVSAQIYEQFSARRKALLASHEETPFWSTEQRSLFDAKTQAELRAISREQLEMLKAALGPDGYLGSDENVLYQKRQFGDLSRDKLDQMQNIAQDYNELRQRIYQEANGVILPEDREKLALLEKEQRADMMKLLTPEEFENYELRSSNTANSLRSALGTFKPSEAEFREIFRATRAAEDRFGSLNQGSPDVIRQIQMAALETLQSSLSPERLADLKQAADPQYQQINRLLTRLDLPSSAAVQVVAVQQDTQKQANAIRTNKELSPEQRNAQLSVLAQEATAKISTSLGGARGLEAYKNYGGQWLQNIAPRPTPTPGSLPGTGTISPKGG